MDENSQLRRILRGTNFGRRSHHGAKLRSGKREWVRRFCDITPYRYAGISSSRILVLLRRLPLEAEHMLRALASLDRSRGLSKDVTGDRGKYRYRGLFP
jgi:hypothetical protein